MKINTMNSSSRFLSFLGYVFSLILLIGCASSDQVPEKEIVYEPIVLYFKPCGCDIKKYKINVEREIVDEGIERYSKKHSMIVDPEIKEELMVLPKVFLQNFMLDEEAKPEGNVVKATADFNETKLEKALEDKPFVQNENTRIYSRRVGNDGSRGLELIKSFQSERRKKTESVDRDRHYRDRIDMIGKIKGSR